MVKFSPMDIVNTLEKMASFAFLLLITSLALFVNLYLLYNHGITIQHLNLEWLKAHATVSEVLMFGVWFVALHLFTFPILHTSIIRVLREINGYLPTKSPSEDMKNPVAIYELRDFAVKNDNATAYKLYEDHIEKASDNSTNTIPTKNLCFSILALTFALWFWFRPVVYAEIMMFPWFINWSLIGFLFFILTILWDEVRNTEFYHRHFIDLPEFQSWTKGKTVTSDNNGQPTRGLDRSLSQAAGPLDIDKLREDTTKGFRSYHDRSLNQTPGPAYYDKLRKLMKSSRDVYDSHVD
jgi:hypothetical protein